MIKRSTWIVLAVFAVFVAFTVWFRGFAEGKTAETPTPVMVPTQPILLSFLSQDVRSLQVQDNQGNVTEVTNSLGNWTLADPAGEKADRASIEAALVSLQGVTVLNTLPGSDLSQYGLDAPTGVITLTLSTGSHVIRIGNPGPSGVYYIQLDSGDLRVVNRSALDILLAFAATPPLAATPTPVVTATITATVTVTPTLVLSPTITITPTLILSPTATVPLTVAITPTEIIPPTVTVTPKP